MATSIQHSEFDFGRGRQDPIILMNYKSVGVLLVNTAFLALSISLWFFWTGYIKPPKGGLHWHFLTALSGTVFSIWSITQYKPKWSLHKTVVNFINILLPSGFIAFHSFMILIIYYNMVDD